ncbi:MAG: hypothetical protein SH819_09015 [Cytophagales bacterium]|nr:hypothetical protein [Cytophagales bacterium]
MKAHAIIFFSLLLLSNCATKKTETTSSADSLQVDSMMTLTPPPALLASSPLDGFSLDNKLTFTDSVNYFLFSSQEELNQKFGKKKGAFAPDFLINYVVAIACKPTTSLTTIVMDKVQTGPECIDVYLTILRGEKQKFVTKPAQVFAIEKRDGVETMHFYVNGKLDKDIALAIN